MDSALHPIEMAARPEVAGKFPVKPESGPNLATQAYTHLRALILGRHVLGGTGLSEGRLAQELNVSRTPMREALVRLAGEGLLEKTPEGIYRVRSVSIREFFECMEVREVLECHAVERAVGMARDEDLQALRAELTALPASDQDDLAHWQFDNRFHSFFATAAQNQALARAIQRDVWSRACSNSSPFPPPGRKRRRAHRGHRAVIRRTSRLRIRVRTAA